MSALRDIAEELGRLDASDRALQRFGWTVGLVLLAVATWLSWRSGWAFTPGAIGTGLWGAWLALQGSVAPAPLRRVHRGWMALAFALGWVMTRVLLGLVYYVLLTPIALVRRTLGRSPILTHPDPTVDSYWLKKEPTAKPEAERLRTMY